MSRSYNETEIARMLGVCQGTLSRDIKVLKSMSQQFVYDLAKSDLSYYFKLSLDGITEAKKEAWKIYNDDQVEVRDKLLALRLIMQSEETRFKLLSEGPSVLVMKSMEDRLYSLEHQEKHNQLSTRFNSASGRCCSEEEYNKALKWA